MQPAGPRHADGLDARLLRAVLDGRSYGEAGSLAGLTASAAERRVRRLARTLQTVVGVVDVDTHAWLGADQLRAHRAQYLEALSRYRPDRVQPRGHAAPTEADIDSLRRLVATHCRQPERAEALLLLLFATALKPAEMARLQVSDYLDADGTVRRESLLRAEAARDGRARPLYFTSTPAVLALDRYLAGRAGHVRARPFRGLDPASPLILAGGPKPERAIHGLLRTVFRYAWSPGMTAKAARRYAAARLQASGVPPALIAAALGLRQRRSVKALQTSTPASPATAMRTLLPALGEPHRSHTVVRDRPVQ